MQTKKFTLEQKLDCLGRVVGLVEGARQGGVGQLEGVKGRGGEVDYWKYVDQIK